MAGYSTTPLWKKLGIKEASRIRLIHAPNHYQHLIQGAPESAKYSARLRGHVDICHLFVSKRSVLEFDLPGLIDHIQPAGMIWVSWPKKASGVSTDVTEDTIREVALPMNLVDVKVCAIDDTWSGLKLVIRKESRQTLCVAD